MHGPLTLEGPQGMLKSSALQALAEPWFTDRISHLGGKDAAMEISGIWLVELAELDALLRATCSMASAPLLPIDRGAWRDC